MTLPGATTPARRETTRTLKGQPPECPRCGYDLSVSTETWPHDRSPTDGLCTDCGLTFRWSEILNPQIAPKWLLEHRFLNPLAWLRALVIPLVPWRAMRELPLTLERRPIVMIAFPPVLLVAFYFAIALSMQSHVLMPSGSQYYNLEDSALWLLWVVLDEFSLMEVYGYESIATPLLLPILAYSVLMPLTFLTMTTTLGKASIRLSHIVRLTSIQLTTVMLWAITTIVVRTALDVLSAHDLISEDEGVFSSVIPDMLNPTVHPDSAGPRSLWLYAIWTLVYWWCACRWYLRLRWAMFHSLVLQLLAFLTFMAVIVVFFGNSL